MGINIDDLPDPGNRYNLGNLLGQGVFGRVYQATDNDASNKNVAIKVQKYEKLFRSNVQCEYKILMDLSSTLYLIDFYGIFKNGDDIWFILEMCDGGPVIDLVQGLLAKNRRISEEHIAHILKETVKALVYLHENNVIHRDIKASNLLLTKEGEVKLCDFNLARQLRDRDEIVYDCVGSPSWMAPELVTANPENEDGHYDNRVDVWALGITAIELAEGAAPFQNMHPTRALFQIVKNPPPILQKVSNWSENFHDFIGECLAKNHEYRPYVMEIIEHPFLAQIPENNYHLTLELKSLIETINPLGVSKRMPEVTVHGKYLKRKVDGDIEKMLKEDLSDLDNVNEESVLRLLEGKLKKGEYHSFIGDILLILNPNERKNIYGEEYHQKYYNKSRSENSPHIYSMADSAYQNAVHHQVPQQIILSGESGSGKTSNYLHLIDHIFYLGESPNVNSIRIKNAIKLIHAFTHASTPANDYSTRCVLKTKISFGGTGKLSAASFKALCLEKWRVSSVDMCQSNFHILYYIYDGIVYADACDKYKLNSERNYRYLRIMEEQTESSLKPRDNIDQNIIKYKKISSYLDELEFSEEQINTIFFIISAILNLGEIRFQENEDGFAMLENKEYAEYFADLLEVDSKKLRWALTNYCLVRKGNVVKKKNTTDEARDARDVLANTLYARLVDYVISVINNKLSFAKAIFGEKYVINLLDYFGFECFKKNHLPQFFVNCFNEQMQYHYLQRIFSWEALDLKGEDVEFEPITYFDNKKTLNQLLSKPEGILSIIDDAAKKSLGGRYVMDKIQSQETTRVIITGAQEFSVAHFTGIVAYNVKEMPDKNRDFLPPELIETMRDSENPIVKNLFTGKLDKTGALNVSFEKVKESRRSGNNATKVPNVNEYSQVKKMRTSGTVFRCICLDLLKELSVGSGSGGTNFVRCVRSDLKGRPQNFHKELVRQQIRAMSVVETAKARKDGYPQRFTFSEFLRRYKFLAFDFEENVEINRDNCRLLLIRLKMEGWAIGNTKVFLKYYNEEYLSRSYETQVLKIVKIQSILRGFLAKCKIAKQVKSQHNENVQNGKNQRRRSSVMTPDEAAGIIQKAYRNKSTKKSDSDILKPLDEKACKFIGPYAKKWKSQSIFHVLIQYRAVKLHDFFNFAQQVHLYNQNVFHNLQKLESLVDMSSIDKRAQVVNWLGELKPAVLKIHFRLDELPYYDTSTLCDPLTNVGGSDRDESWDTPYRWRENQLEDFQQRKESPQEPCELINIPYTRDPGEPFAALPNLPDLETKSKKNKENSYVQKQSPRFDERKHMYNDNRENLTSVQLRKQEIKSKYEENFIFNSTPANKDFEYIKASSITSKPKHADPVTELRNIARQSSAASDDEPPFNFQGMLRKTNFQRESLKKAVRRFSFAKDQSGLVNGKDFDEPIYSKSVSMELMPGLIIRGVEVEL